MGIHHRFSVASAIALLLLVIVHTNADKCRTGCHGIVPNVFKYKEGTTYKYSYEGSVDVSLSGADQQQTGTKIKANVLLTPLKDCQQLVRLENVQIIGPDAKKYNSKDDLKKGVRIVFHDGHIEDEICTEPEDSQHSLNIKRAVISLFQAATKRNTEIDVFGACPTSFSTSKEAGAVVIRKNRDLNRCAHRESINDNFIALSFNPNSDIKSSPLLSGDYSSEQRVKNGILEHAEVTEHYLYKPFSAGQNGAKATVVSKLHLTGQQAENVAPKTVEPRTILFENPHIVNTPTSNVNNLLNALKKALDSSTGQQVVKPTAARDFTTLVNTLRVTSKDDVLAVYGTVKAGAGVKDKQAAKKIFLEALYRAGTGDAIEVAIELLKNKEIPAEHQKLFFLSLAFVKHATSKSLGTAASLLNQPNLPREAYLGVGTLAGRYCMDHKCDNDENLDKLTKTLLTKLGSCQVKSREEENTLIAVLKGLANFRRINDNIVNVIAKCANDKKNQVRVRVAALETFLADASKPKLIKTALEILKNRNEDAEIRIKAYLVAAQAPTAEVANTLKDLLTTEPVNQVGSFIVSHLRNIRSSTNPNKELAKQHLGLLRSPKRFPVDIRRFSFNTELSYAIDSLGLAASVETNVIYSQDSFLPRSGNFNLTTELFGHTFNFLELGVRQENLDRVIEHYLGPQGVLKKSKASDILEQSKHEIHKIAEKIRQRFDKTRRGRRAVSEADILKFAKSVKLATSQIDQALDLDLSVKLFGSEIVFLTVNEAIHELNPEAVVDKIFDYIDGSINKAKHFEHNFGHHAVFLDMSVAYPTSVGLPLKLGVVGTAAVQAVTSGNVDIRRILQDPKNAQFAITMVPSANIELVGAFTIDAHEVETGLVVTSSLHTATGSELSVKLLNNGKGVDVKLGLPIEKQDVVTIGHTIVFATRELGHEALEVPLKFTGQRKEYHGCFDQLSPVVGLTFCGELGVPINSIPGMTIGGVNAGASPFPLSGPAKLSLKIQRDDAKDYHFRALLQDDVPEVRKLEITFETPNSKTNRKISLLIEAGVKPDKYVIATLVSPIKSATLEGRIINNDNEMSVNAKFSHDNQEYSGKLGAKVSGNAASSRYTPLIQFKTPQMQSGGSAGYNVEGAIVVEQKPQGRKVTFDKVRLVTPNAPPVEIQGFLGKDGPTYAADLSVSQDKKSGSFKGSVTFVSPENIKFDAEIQNTLNPNLNAIIKAEHQRGPGSFDNKFEFVHGQNLKNSKNKFTLDNSGKYQYENSKKFDLSFKNKMTYPLVNLVAKVDGHFTQNSAKYDVEVSYDKFKVESELDAKADKATGAYSIDFDVAAADNKLKFKSSREVTGPNKSKLKNELEVQGKKYELNADVVHQLKPDDVNAQIDANLVVHGKPQPIKIKQGLVFNPTNLEVVSEINDGGIKYLDVQFKTNRAGNANGNTKINVPDIVVVDGNVVVKDGKGTGSILVNLKKLNRKLKGDASFTISKPNYNADVSVFFDFEKDPAQKITFNTVTKATGTSIDSKNKFNVLSNVFEVNVNGNLQGKFNDGTIVGGFDVTLPTGDYFAGKVNRDLHVVQPVKNAKINSELEYRPAGQSKGHKLIWNWIVKDSDFKDTTNVQFSLQGVKISGEDVKVEVNVDRHPKGEQKSAQLSAKLSGSLVSLPVEVTSNSLYNRKVGNYQLDGKVGSGTSVNVQGKYDYGHTSNKYSHDVKVHVKLPLEKYKTMTFETSVSATKPKTENDEYEFTTANVFGLNDKTIKLDGSLRGHKTHGSGKAVMTLSDSEPITVSAGFKNSNPEAVEINADIEQSSKTPGKNIKLGFTLSQLNANQVNFKVAALTPAESARSIDLSVNLKRGEDNHKFTGDAALSVDAKKYTWTHDLFISETNPSIDLKVTYPENQHSQIAAKFNKIAENKFNGEVVIKNIQGFSLETSGDAHLDTVDNFQIKGKIHSEKLNLKDVQVEIVTKPDSTGKRLQFSVKSENNNLVSGSSTYRAKEEAGKLIVEGSGTFKVKEESQQSSFKFIRKILDPVKDGEKGLEITLNGVLGPKKFVSELIISDKQFHFNEQYCKENNKDCAHIDVTAMTTPADAKEFKSTLEVSVDLRKLGTNHEFGLKSVFERKELNVVHTIDLYFQAKEKTAYQYKVYVQPSKAGLLMTLPKRVIAVEGVVTLNKAPNKMGSIKSEVVVQLDKKNHPEKKSTLSLVADVTSDDKEAAFNGEVKFSNPDLKKDLILSANGHVNKDLRKASATVDVDVFAKKNQKFTITGEVSGTPAGEKGINLVSKINVDNKAQNIHIEGVEQVSVSTDGISVDSQFVYKDAQHTRKASFVLKAAPQEVELTVKTPTIDLVHLQSQMQIVKDSVTARSELSVFGEKPFVADVEIKDLTSLKLYVEKQDGSKQKLYVAAGINAQVAEVKTDLIQGGKTLNVFHGSLHLDDANFLKSDYGANTENAKKLIEETRKYATSYSSAAKNTVEKIKQEVSDEIKHLRSQFNEKSLPDFKAMVESYKEQLNDLRTEIVSDQTLQEASEFLKKTFGATFQTINELLQRTVVLIQKIYEAFEENWNKVLDVFTKEVLPQLKDSATKLFHVVSDFVEHITNAVLIIVTKIGNTLQAHEEDFKKLGKIISEMSQDVGRSLAKVFHQVRVELVNFINATIEQIKALPISDIIREKYAELTGGAQVPEHIFEILNEFVNTFKGFLPTNELQEAVQLTYDYIVQKLKQQKVDDSAALKKIYESILKAIQSVIKLVQAQGGVENIQDIVSNNIPLSFASLSRIPTVVSVKLSPLRYILSDDLPSLKEIILAYRPRLHPLDNVPPYKLHAMLVDGQHIFSYDARHLTFPGKCDYILSQDVLDGNFSLSANLADGVTKSLTLFDKSGSVTVDKDGRLTHNGKSVEYPVEEGSLSAWRRYYSVHLKSASGIHVKASPDLRIVSVEVSGFYRNRLRGLLGNGNDEEYDDFILPNGQVTEKDGDFGNAYKIGGCPDVQRPADKKAHHQTSPKCAALFGSDSRLRYCFPVINPEIFRHACEDAAGQKATDAQCQLAVGYTYACRDAGIPVNVPDVCAKCEHNGKVYNVGDSGPVKSPQGKADVVFIYEQTKFNEPLINEFIAPLVQQLNADLKAQGITDVKYAIVGYDDGDWPSHYTNGGKLEYTGKPINAKFSEPKQRVPLTVGNEVVDNVLNKAQDVVDFVKRDLGQTSPHLAAYEVSEYPFRPDASRAVFLIAENNCNSFRNKFGLSLLQPLYLRNKYTTNGVTFNVLSPLADLGADVKEQKVSKSVIGFTKDAVLTFADAKKKTFEDNKELKDQLKYGSDSCVDFAESNYGAVFSSSVFKESKGNQKKSFIQVVSKSLVNQLTVEYTRQCTCELLSGFVPRTKCRTISRGEKCKK